MNHQESSARLAEPIISRLPGDRRVAVVGGGPAGMTTALLLARAGRSVTLFEGGRELGGLWAARFDEEGYFVGENSCKVYQGTYHTAPHLFRLIGTSWESHFVSQYSLRGDWLVPFVRACTASDLAVIAAEWARFRVGLGAPHECSVEAFLERNAMSETCRDWLRATALGGIAGTLRMTVWELFHRIGANLDALFTKRVSTLFWNAQPPNAPDGFLTRWTRALADAGVELRTSTAVQSLQRVGHGVRLVTNDGHFDAASVALALPPPALARLLGRSDASIASGFGYEPDRLRAVLRDSVYEHLGITWFFDRAFDRGLPLGGHNVRRGWHPIVREYPQYRPWLRPPAVTAVVGSISLDTDFAHPRRKTRASQHTHEELAAILWEDERRADPSLPEPIGFRVYGMSSATQLVRHGPLPSVCAAAPVFLATNLAGQAPYVTSSLESAIQAGAAAALAIDSSVERLPTGAAHTRTSLPWAQRASDERRFEVSTELPANVERAWQVFAAIDRWPQWSRFVRSVRGDMRPGSTWDVTVLREDDTRATARPVLQSVAPFELVFEQRFGAAELLRLEHTMRLEPIDATRCRLRQTLRASGVAQGALWERACKGLARYEAVGEDLARHLRATSDRATSEPRATAESVASV